MVRDNCSELELLYDNTNSGSKTDENMWSEMLRGRSSSQITSCVDMNLLTSQRRRIRPRMGRCSRWMSVALWDRALNSWRRILRKRPKDVQEWCNFLFLNGLVMVVTLITGILTYESSVEVLRQSLGKTVLFPIHLPQAIGLSIGCKWKNSTILGVFAGFFTSRIYAAARAHYLISTTRGVVIFAASFLGTAEVFTESHFLHKALCRENGRKIPTIESIKEAIQYLVIVLICTLVFDTLITLVFCSSSLVLWPDYYLYWGTNWLGVLSGILTISPAATHFLAWKPRPSLLRPRKLVEAFSLTVVTVGLVIIIFISNLQTIIHPLPYLLFPIIILSAFRFNRLGCALVVFTISYVCAWSSVRGKGALYRMAGSPTPVSSPKLILQIELFTSVLGLVGILLAAAVREKKQLARDLHNMNEELENTVSQRTQELVKANEDLKESQRKAEEASQAKSDFLANMSHEIRTPIHGIMGMTALLLDSDLSVDQRDSLQSVTECANLLLHIINSILDLAKIEAGRVEVEFVPFNVRVLVTTTVRMLHTRAKEKSLALVCEVDETVPEWMVGDSGKIQQCLLNLIGNALKFTHEGSVTVQVKVDGGYESAKCSVYKDSEDQIRVATDMAISDSSSSGNSNDRSSPARVISVFAKPSDWKCCSLDIANVRKSPNVAIYKNDGSLHCVPVVFEVRDTGIGISSEKLQDIFTPFTQADASTSRLYGGTGLGLCIVQRFVELLGGKLQAESEMGKGSCFSFYVPLGLSSEIKENSDSSSKGRLGGCCNRNCESSPDTADEVASAGLSDAGSTATSYVKGVGHEGAPNYGLELLVNMNASNKCIGQYSLDAHRHTTVRTHSETLPSSEMAWKPRISVENLDLMLASWKEGVLDKDSMSVTRDCRCSDSETSLKGCNSVAMSSPSTKTLGCCQQPSMECSKPTLKQCAADQTAQRPFFGVETPLKCSLTVERSDRSKVDVRSYSSTNFVDTVVPSCSGETRQKPSVPYTSQKQRGSDDSSERTHQSHTDLKLHVLLAEDNVINQKVASRQLEKYGHIVTVVGDGLHVLEAVRANPNSFDLILMDVQMPQMDGLEATRRIREEELLKGRRRLPILGLTAHAIHGYEQTCLSCGMDGYLGKPFDINQLLDVIDKYLPPARLMDTRR